MCFAYISEQTATFVICNTELLDFVTETECVYCAVRSRLLGKNRLGCVFKGLILVSYSVDIGLLCLEVNRPGNEADYSPPYGTEVKNEYMYQPTTSYSFMGCIWTTSPLCLPFNIILPSASSSSKLSLCINFVSLPCMPRSSNNSILYPK